MLMISDWLSGSLRTCSDWESPAGGASSLWRVRHKMTNLFQQSWSLSKDTSRVLFTIAQKTRPRCKVRTELWRQDRASPLTSACEDSGWSGLSTSAGLMLQLDSLDRCSRQVSIVLLFLLWIKYESMRLYLTDILLRELWFYIKKQSRCVCGNQFLLVNQLWALESQ